MREPVHQLLILLVLLLGASAPAWASTSVVVQDFENESALPKVWTVGAPEGSARVERSESHPHDGKACLDLQYHFTAGGQYLGVSNRVRIQAPIHRVHFWLYGDGSGCGYGLYLADAGDETHKFRDPASMKIDFKGWKEIVVDLDQPHESWGGDKNGKIDYPITAITFEISHDGNAPVQSDLYFDGISVDSERSADETLGGQIDVVSPGYCSDVKGDTRVVVSARGFRRLTAKCWKQGEGFGVDSTAAEIDLDQRGNGSFTFAADQYPHGPITVRIGGESGVLKDNCYLQLYNLAGVSWNEGMPKDPPPAAAGMSLVFADDFSGPLSISSTDPKARYFDHKPLGGDFSTLPFTRHGQPGDPFARVDTYLRIRADANKNSAGLLSSLTNDGQGVKASLPCYFECRFIGPNAIGTWPAFWLMTDYPSERRNGKPAGVPTDELDVIEAYGGEGPREPNSHDSYQVTPHAWNQGEAGKAAESQAYAQLHNPVSMGKHGIPSSWFESLHVYGCKITASDTIYYCDNIEMGRHKTLETCKRRPLFFLVNLATGGGWPVDLSRYGGRADMYVDYIRVYQGTVRD